MEEQTRATDEPSAGARFAGGLLLVLLVLAAVGAVGLVGYLVYAAMDRQTFAVVGASGLFLILASLIVGRAMVGAARVRAQAVTMEQQTRVYAVLLRALLRRVRVGDTFAVPERDGSDDDDGDLEVVALEEAVLLVAPPALRLFLHTADETNPTEVRAGIDAFVRLARDDMGLTNDDLLPEDIARVLREGID